MTDRELDALVVEQVFGLKLEPVVLGEPNSYLEDLPAYSRDIAAAWAVVERLHGLGWVVEVTYDNGTGRYCDVWRMGNDGQKVGHRADEKTVPLAICRAALEAVG